MIKEKGIYTSQEASILTIYNFANKLLSSPSYKRYRSATIELMQALETMGSIADTFEALSKIATIASSDSGEESKKIRRIALALSYSELEEEDFASREDLEWIPRVKEGLTSYGLESMEYQITDDASSFQEAWVFPGNRIIHPELGTLLIGVDYDLEPRTAKPIPSDKVALSVFFETIVPDSKGTATKHILPLYLILVENNKRAVKLGILKLRWRVGLFRKIERLTKRFDYIKSIKS